MQELVIGLGSNLADRRKNIETAVSKIGERIGPVSIISSIAETEPWGFESGNKFLNCAILIEDEPAPGVPCLIRLRQVIDILQSIELEFGRVRTGVYADRIIDLDILFYGDEILEGQSLTVPHPRLHERDFILNSLMEICPDKIHPVLQKTIRDLFSPLKKGQEANSQFGGF